MTNYKGKKIGRLEVLERSSRPEKNYSSVYVWWTCKCDCGSVVVRRSDSLTRSIRESYIASCGCYKREHINGMNSRFALRPFEALYNIFTRCALKRGETFITYDEFVAFTENKECHYCGDTLRWREIGARGKFSGYNIDRKDNRIGYVKENCVPCCGRCNVSRADRFTYEEWLQIGKLIRSWRSK